MQDVRKDLENQENFETEFVQVAKELKQASFQRIFRMRNLQRMGELRRVQQGREQERLQMFLSFI